MKERPIKLSHVSFDNDLFIYSLGWYAGRIVHPATLDFFRELEAEQSAEKDGIPCKTLMYPGTLADALYAQSHEIKIEQFAQGGERVVSVSTLDPYHLTSAAAFFVDGKICRADYGKRNIHRLPNGLHLTERNLRFSIENGNQVITEELIDTSYLLEHYVSEHFFRDEDRYTANITGARVLHRYQKGCEAQIQYAGMRFGQTFVPLDELPAYYREPFHNEFRTDYSLEEVVNRGFIL